MVASANLGQATRRERAAYKKPPFPVSSKAAPPLKRLQKKELFRPHIGIAAGAAGRRDHRCVAGRGRRRM